MGQQRRAGQWHPLLAKLIQFAATNPKLATKLVEDHPEALTLRTGLGETALHYLAVEDYDEAVQLLIDLGAEVNVVNKFGHSPLAEATLIKNQRTIEVLRSAGARNDQMNIDLDCE